MNLTCPCGAYAPCEATRDEDFRMRINCLNCERSWTHWELIGWRDDNDPDDGWEDDMSADMKNALDNLKPGESVIQGKEPVTPQAAEMLRREQEMQHQAKRALETLASGDFHKILHAHTESDSEEVKRHWFAEANLSNGDKVLFGVEDTSVSVSIVSHGTRTGTTEQRIEGRTQESLTESRG